MIQRRQTVGAVAVVLALGCAHAPPTGVVAGTVSYGGKWPIQFGYVAVMETGSDHEQVKGRTFAANTDAYGKYVIPNVPVGMYRVRGRQGGFIGQDRDSVHVSEHDTTIVNFDLKWTVIYK